MELTAHTKRDLDHRVLGGVCAGIAARYKYGILGVRLMTVMLVVLTGGVGGLAYVALWRFLPPTSDESRIVMGTDPTAVSKPTMPDSSQIYGPVALDLPLVDEALLSLTDAEIPWLGKMLEPVVTGGGKKLRPAIALLSGRIGNYNLEMLIPLAASVELLHTATLVHDDVIDNAPMRRGQATPASLFGNAASVMLGDYMFAHAADFVAQTGNIRVVRNFARTLRVMANGELQQDISAFEYSDDVQRYLDRIGGKTASLFATAAEGGGIVSGVPDRQVNALRRYGEALGMAFQIVDDALDFTGNPEEMGKPVGSDLREGTLTLPTIFYLQNQPEDNPVKRAFDDIDREQNLTKAIEEIRNSDAIDQVADVALRFGSRAREALFELPDCEPRTTLDGLISHVLERRT